MIIWAIVVGLILTICSITMFITGRYAKFVKERTANPNPIDKAVGFPVGMSFYLMLGYGIIFLILGFICPPC